MVAKYRDLMAIESPAGGHGRFKTMTSLDAE